MLIGGLSGNGSAHLAADEWDALAEVVRLIVERVQRVAPDEAEATKDQLAALLKVWADAGEERENMKYQNKNLEAALMVRPEEALTNDEIEYSQREVPWPTLQSMRDVDAESSLYQIPLKKVK
ncbi:hypothetical protein A5777_02990 [Gordonia sp. 852002-10350_SCH5691597]|nr:hypothetical protein A5777_02990 [Gordonia sp. 852002-10350_SCH5691597]